MSELTPQQWDELDFTASQYADTCDSPECTWCRATEQELVGLLKLHHRTLIDAARPKCQRCDGSGIHMGDCPGTSRYHECAECDGTGRAA